MAMLFGGGGIRASCGSPSRSPTSVADRTRVSSASTSEREPEAEDEAEDQAEHRVLLRRRGDLAGAVRRADHVGPRGLQRLQRRELLILVAQAGRELGAVLALGRQLVEPLRDLGASTADGIRVELTAVGRERLRVCGRERSPPLRVAVRDGEGEDARVALRRDARRCRAARRPRFPSARERNGALRDGRDLRERRLRVGQLDRVDVLGADPGERAGEVLGAEVHLRRRLILSGLARREDVRRDGDDDRADEDDPLSAAENAQIRGQRSCLM